MFQSVQQRYGDRAPAAINIAPLIDVVFILLIFVLVTTTFARDRGVQIRRPAAQWSQSLHRESLRISITAAGDVYLEGRRLERAQIAAAVRRFVEQEDGSRVIVIADEQVTSGTLVAVMDDIRRGGAGDVALATRERGGAQ